MIKEIELTPIKHLFRSITPYLNSELIFIKKFDSCNLPELVENFISALEIKIGDIDYENLFLFLTLLIFQIESNSFDIKTDEICVKVKEVKERGHNLIAIVEIIEKG